MTIPRRAQSGAIALLVAGLLAGVSPLSVAAQTTSSPPPQTIPGLDGFSLPSSRPTPQTTPVPDVTPAPTPAPTPSPTVAPTPRATPTPTERPTPRATAPSVRVTPTPTPTPRVTPAPERSVTAAPTPTATPPAMATPVAAEPSPVAAPTTPVQDEAKPVASGGGGGWLAAGAALATLVAGLVWWRRRRAIDDTVIEDLGVAPEAEAASQPAQVSRPAALAAAAPAMLDPLPVPGERARVTMTLHPRRAGLNLLSATVEAELLLRNEGIAPAAAIRVGALLMGAAAGPPGDVGPLFAQPVGRPVTPPFALAPGEERRVRLVVARSRSEIEPLEAGGRPMFVPVVAINVLYDAGGMQGQTAQAYAVGVERVDSAKLSPLWLDQPARMFDAIGSRAYAAGVVR